MIRIYFYSFFFFRDSSSSSSWLFHRLYVLLFFFLFFFLYTNIQVMRLAFSSSRFFLVFSFLASQSVYTCPSSHLSNYLLIWNTFLCGCLLFLFFISLCIYRVSQTVTTGSYISLALTSRGYFGEDVDLSARGRTKR